MARIHRRTIQKKIFMNQMTRIKWALGSITMKKSNGGDGIPVELFQILKDMLWKCCTQYTSKFGKLSSGHRTGKGQFLFHSQRRTMPKSVSTTIQFSHSVVSDSLQPHGLKHTRLPCLLPTPRACSNSCPSSRWCHPTISSSVVPFSSCLQSSPASG